MDINFSKVRIYLLVFLLSIAGTTVLGAGKETPQKPVTSDGELIQVAVLLDTSSSMDGLIEQAKSALWKMVNELALAHRNGKSPKLEVSLYEYGKDSLPSGEGYMRMILALTTDLDKVSEELFKLTTNGGEEYCGMVIDRAVNSLQWNKNPSTLKIIYIAGNEPFTQGKVDYLTSCSAAIKKGIVVNTIFCGSKEEGISTKWKDAADRSDGIYINIDQNRQAVVINAPQDDEIIRLGSELNTTFIAFGSGGEKRKTLQEEQDKKAESVGQGMMVERSLAKSSSQYAPAAAAWDVVSASESGTVKVESLKDDELPKELKGKTSEEKKVYVQKMVAKRAEIQKKIDKLNMERRKYVEAETKKQSSADGFDSAVLKSVRALAISKKFVFE